MNSAYNPRGIPSAFAGGISFGGDYNPEQWPEEIWDEDMRYFREAGINTVTLNVFSWAALQPSEDVYDFSRLDRIVDKAEKNGLQIIMATSTAAHPAWMAHRHPDILRVDDEGRKRKFGGRHNSCPSSPTYRKYAPLLAGKLAERYASHGAVKAWHISNEYGGLCFCENCEKAFRVWLRKKYGSLDELNRAWNTSFWGHTFYDWDEIVAPSLISENFLMDGRERTMEQGILLDYHRFQSDALLDCMKLERDAILKVDPVARVTTNLMGFFPDLDYFRWAGEMDFVSWDNYPSNGDSWAHTAMSHDLMRSIGGNRPFFLMEQTPSVTNWQPYNALKRPGMLRLQSYQALAHGSESVMFFQLRRSVGGCEKLHGAVIDHVGTNNTRVFREVKQIGSELKALGNSATGGNIHSDVAMLFDWDNWWAVTDSAGPSVLLDYRKEQERIYEPLRSMNYSIDFVSQEMLPTIQHKVLIAPVLYMMKKGTAEAIREFVEKGGTFITGFFSGYADENDLIITGGYPGSLRDVLGIWVEEEDALPEGETNHFTVNGKKYEASLLCDIIHTEGACQIGGGYEEDFYAGSPVITRNRYGKGEAWYIGTASTEDFYRDIVGEILRNAGVRPVLDAPKEVEVTCREKEGYKTYYLLNHSGENQSVALPIDAEDLFSHRHYRQGNLLKVGAHDVAILRSKR